MNIPVWVWVATVAGLLVLTAADLFLADSDPHRVTTREATRRTAFYVALAVLFGVGIMLLAGGRHAGEFAAGYLLEYSLSVDNLFVFLLLMNRFAVPEERRQQVLVVGIVVALALRGVFIAVGAAAINAFSFTFYVFGAFLLWTAWHVARHGDDDVDLEESRLLRIIRRLVPATTEYDEGRLTVRRAGRRLATPLLLVMIAIGAIDLMFALDSIPAIFGVTKEPFLVFTANAFALLGLRSLFFLVNDLLDRLVHLNLGLAVILAFIGGKLVLEAMHEGGLGVPVVPTWLSLVVIVAVLGVTTLASLRTERKRLAEAPVASDG